MTDTIELVEHVLHTELEKRIGQRVPGVLAVTPGKINIGADLFVYHVWTPEAHTIHTAKLNYKNFLRAICYAWNGRGVKLEMGISLSQQHPKRQKYMLASAPAFHAKRCQEAFNLLCEDGSLFRENFDPWLVVNGWRWLYEAAEE